MHIVQNAYFRQIFLEFERYIFQNRNELYFHIGYA